MTLRDANLQLTKKTLSHIVFHVYFAFIFSVYNKITSSEVTLKMCEQNFFQEI